MLNNKEIAAIEAWETDHYKVCTLGPQVSYAIALCPYEIRIRKNSVAYTVMVVCDCGVMYNATDYDCW